MTYADSKTTASYGAPIAIVFGDMQGSAIAAEKNEIEANRLQDKFHDAIKAIAQRFHATFFKIRFEGDGFMATFTHPFEMVEFGIAAQLECARHGWFVRLAGHWGVAEFDPNGDPKGQDVIRAARLLGHANANVRQFLVTDLVRAVVRNRLPHIEFRTADVIQVKGIEEPLEVWEAAPATGRTAQIAPSNETTPTSVQLVSANESTPEVKPANARWQMSGSPAAWISAAIAIAALIAGLPEAAWYVTSFLQKVPITAPAMRELHYLYARTPNEAPISIKSGTIVESGGYFWLSFEAGEKLHAYLVLRDDHENAYALFPPPETQELTARERNPLAAGRFLSTAFHLEKQPGKEHLWLFVATTPIPSVEAFLRSFDRNSKVPRRVLADEESAAFDALVGEVEADCPACVRKMTIEHI